MSSSDALGRHDLVWVDSSGLVRGSATRRPEEEEIVRGWLDLDRPLVVSRRPADLPPNLCALGLPLSVRQGKRRIAVRVMTDAIREVRRPPALAQITTTAPVRCRRAFRELDRLARKAGIALRVYGSMAWQFLTGETYVTGASDIDLLWRPSSLADLHKGVAMLSGWEEQSGIRADGEVLLPDGSGMSWREWARGPRELMVKSIDGVRMRAVGELLQMLTSEMECKHYPLQSARLRSAR